MGQNSSSKNRAQPRQPSDPGQPGWRRLLTPREARGALAVAVVLITSVALWPGDEGRATLIGWDKLDHVVSFAALTILARAGWPHARRWWAAGLLGLYGILIELLQSTDFVGRTASISDFAANCVGVALGLALALWLARVARTLSWLPERR